MASTRRISSLIAVVAGLLLLPALPADTASAAVSCTLSTGTLNVSISAGTNQVSVQRGTGGNSNDIIVFDGFFTNPQSCSGSPTVTNTDTINITDGVATQATAVNLGLQNGAFEPGATTPETGTAEIEIIINASDGTDTTRVFAGGSPDIYRFGSTGATSVGGNLNNDDDVDDVTINDGEQMTIDGGAGTDDLSANGGTGFAGPVPYASGGMAVLHLDGGPNDDVMTGGPGGWVFDSSGPQGNDTMTGGAGTDEAHMELGNDTADGGAGSNDFASYQFSLQGVHFDLGLSGQQDTITAGLDTATNFENVVGSQMSNSGDVLIGDGGANRINANAGDDLLVGKGGDDTLNASAGTDTVSYANGSTGPITLSLATVAPQATGGAGTDTLLDVNPADGLPDAENIVGSPFGDTLTGNALANQIDVRDGVADTADCVGPANGNRAIADVVGVDSIANCETIDFLTTPPPAVQDTLAPDTFISGKAKVKTRKKKVLVSWILGSSEPGSSFQCSIDGRPFLPCTSPFTAKLRRGAHTLSVRATDAAGNQDGSAASFTTRVKPKK